MHILYIKIHEKLFSQRPLSFLCDLWTFENLISKFLITTSKKWGRIRTIAGIHYIHSELNSLDQWNSGPSIWRQNKGFLLDSENAIFLLALSDRVALLCSLFNNAFKKCRGKDERAFQDHTKFYLEMLCMSK